MDSEREKQFRNAVVHKLVGIPVESDRDDYTIADIEKLYRYAIKMNDAPHWHVELAGFYARFGLYSDAIDTLEEGLKRGYNEWDKIDSNTQFDYIRKFGQYKALLAKYRQEKQT